MASSRQYSGAAGAPTPAPTPSSPPATGVGGGGAFPFSSSPGGVPSSSPAGAAAVAVASHFHHNRHGNTAEYQQQRQQFNRPRRKRRRRRSTLSDGSRPGFGVSAGLHPRVPRGLDLTYVTDRIIGMAAPAITQLEEDLVAAAGGPIPVPRALPQSPAAVTQSPAATSAMQRVPQSPADATVPPPQPQPTQRPVPQSPAIPAEDASPVPAAVPSSTGASGEEPPPRQPRKTSSLAAAVAASGSGSAADAAAGPAEATVPSPGSSETHSKPAEESSKPLPEEPQPQQQQQQSPPPPAVGEGSTSESTTAASATVTASDVTSPGYGPVSRKRPHQQQHPVIAQPQGNPCDELKKFLARNHDPGGGAAGNFLAINVSDEPLRYDDEPSGSSEALDAFGGQVINVGWVSPARGRGCQNPSVVHLSRICYAMHAFLSLGAAGDGDNVYHRGRIKNRRGGGGEAGHRSGGFGLGLLGEFLDGGTNASPGGPPRITPNASFDDLTAPPSSSTTTTGGGVVAVYCSNGKTRTGIVIACYLKYSGVVPSTLAGFHLFCRRRACVPADVSVSEYVPPSLRQFFSNFDDVVELGGFANPEPLYLRAITVQGLPVDDAPAVDVWDVTGGHVYSSHPISDDDDRDESDDGGGGDGAVVATSTAGRGQWADEEGFYRVDRILHGDFALTCRFGGRYASDVTDPRKILFRYVNHTGCVCRGPLELPMIKVDVMRRYADDIDEDDFLVCLMFDSVPADEKSTMVADGDGAGAGEGEARVARIGSSRKRRRLPPVLDGAEAVAMGWTFIAATHAVVAATGGGVDDDSGDDPPLARLRRFVGSDRSDTSVADGDDDFVVPEEACVVALKLTNLDVGRARDELFHGRLRNLWDLGGDGGGGDDGDGGGSIVAASGFDHRGVLSSSNPLVTPSKRRRRALADSFSSGDGSRSAIVPDGTDDDVVVDGAKAKLDLDLARLLPELGRADDADAEATSAETARMGKVLDGIDLGDGVGGGVSVGPLVAEPGSVAGDDEESAMRCSDARANANANAASVVGSVLYSPIVPPTRSDVLDAFAASDPAGGQHVHNHRRVPFLGRVLGRPPDGGAAGDAHSLALTLPGDGTLDLNLPLLPLTRGEDGTASPSWSSSPASSAGRRRRRISDAGDSVVRTFRGVTGGLFRSSSRRRCQSGDFADDLQDAASLKRICRGDYDSEEDHDLDDGDGFLHPLAEGGDPSVVDMLMELSHTGVTVRDLASLARESSFVDDYVGEGLDDDVALAAIIREEESETNRAVKEGITEEPGEVDARVNVEEDEQDSSRTQQTTARSSSSSLSKALASEKARPHEPQGQTKRAKFSKSSSLGRALAASQKSIADAMDGSVEGRSRNATNGGLENEERRTPKSSLAKAAAASAATFKQREADGSRESVDDSVGMSDAIAAAAEAAVETAVAASAERRLERQDDGDAEKAKTRSGGQDVGMSAAKAASVAEEAVAAVAEKLGPKDDGGDKIAMKSEEDVGMSAARAAAAAAVEGRLGPTEAKDDAAPTSSEDSGSFSVARAAAAAAMAKMREKSDDGEETSSCQPTTSDAADALLSATTAGATEHATKTTVPAEERGREETKDGESSSNLEGKGGFSAAKAAAAAALAKRQGLMGDKSGDVTTSKADGVGMSAAKAAAAAAIAKRQGVSDEGSTANPPPDAPASGGFSAAKAAAAAAIAKRQGMGGVKMSAEQEEAPNGLSAAKAAAAAAMSRRQGGSGTQEDSAARPAIQPAGISAAKAAAAAAMAKRQGGGADDENSSTKPSSASPGGLNAAKAAAAAAMARRQGRGDGGDKGTVKPTAPAAMSAAKAAAAAALARRQGNADDKECSKAGSSGGISAAKAAAAAAMAKRQGQVHASDEETVRPTAPVPMSAAKAAAAAALARRQGNADEEEYTEPGASDGISAAKAAAAAAMAKRHGQEGTGGNNSSTPTASVGMSAAKAAAAAALAKKQGGGYGTTTELPSSNGMSAAKAAAAAAMARRLGPPGPDNIDSSASPDSSSGMSAAKAAAAAAMLKRTGKATDTSEQKEESGISAARAAAAAAMAKRQGEPNELKKKPNVVGMSAAKAAAAAAMAKREAQVGDSSASEPTQAPGENLQDGCRPTEQMASGSERPALKDDPEYEKYFKMLKVGLPMGAVPNALIRDGKDPAVMDGDHSKPAPLVVPLKEDPEYSKYFKMLKVGLPVGAAKNALVRDGKNPAIMDLDPDKPLSLQQLPNDDDDADEDDDEEEEAEGGDDEVGVHAVHDGESSAETAVPLKQDPEYEKYFRMLKMGLPMGAVQNALVRDGKDPGIMDLDPEKSLASQVKSNDDKDGPPLKEDPEYEKYFRMLKMGLPMGAVQNALVRDGKDPGIMDLDPDKSLASQTKSDDVDDGPPLKEDPDYEKYFRMLKMGLPMGAVQNALVRDGKDPGIMDLDPEKSLASQMQPNAEAVDDGPPLKEDPDYEKYFKMLKMGLPMGAVQNALVRDGKDPGIMDLDPDKSLSSQMKPDVVDVDDGPPLKEDPDFEKYFKMLKMGLPMGAVQNALVRDGKDPGIMDLDPEKSLASQLQSNVVDDGPPLKEDPDYEKYFKMLKMGLPMGAVKNALVRDGKDPGIMDLDPDKSLASNTTTKSIAKKDEKKSRKKKLASKEKKKKVRRKKIFWTSIDESKIDKESIWSLVQGTVPMEKLKYDTAEFENLFTETASATDKKKTEKKGSKEAKPKKSVQVIDGKRGMNGGIILARLKLDFSDLAKSVDMMDARNLDVTQLKALQEFLPTDEEAGGLRSYLRNASKSEEAKQAAMHDLCACEKYMVAMMDVKDAKAKFDCMLFKAQFETRRAELIDDIKTVIKACDDLRGSIRLRKLMAMILALGNQINTGGTGNVAAGFTLDALLKLNEAKAFDKKTSVLLYLVKLVKQNDEDLLTFKDDILSTEAAERIMLDAISADMKQLKEELKHVNEAAQVDGDKRRLEEATIQKKLSLEELSEQKTFTRNVEGVTHYNRMVNEDDLTKMERFGREAEKKMDEAFSLELEMKEKYTKLLKYFGEDEKMASSDFFGTICRFISEFDAAYEQLKKLDLAKAKEEKRRKKEEERRAAKQAKEAKKAAASKKPEDDVQAKEAREAAKKAEEVVLMLGSICSGNFPTEDITKEATVDKGDIASAAAPAALTAKKETDAQSSQRGEDASPRSEFSAAKVAAAAAMARRLGAPDGEDQKAAGSSNLGGFSAAKAAAAAAMSSRMAKGDAANDKSPANSALPRSKWGEEEVDENQFETEKPDSVGIGSSAASAVMSVRSNEENSGDMPADMTGTEGDNPTCRQGSVAGEVGDKESFLDVKGIASIALSKSKEACGADASPRQEGISELTITPGGALFEGKGDKRKAPSSRTGARREAAGLLASSLQPNMGLLSEIENRRKERPDHSTPQDPDAPKATSVTRSGAHPGCVDNSTNNAASEDDQTGMRELSSPTKLVASVALDAIADGTCGEIGTGLELDGDHDTDAGEDGTNASPKIKGNSENCPQFEDLGDEKLTDTDVVVVDKKSTFEENDRAANEPTQGRASETHSDAEKGKKPNENDVAAAQGGGIASAAAAAAAVEKSQQPRESFPSLPSGGIAAAAAAAALKKSKHPKEGSTPPSSGGAAAAITTALEKDKQSKESIQTPGSGGIAAAAAAAALKKGKQPKESSLSPASGGIAAAAAAAALKKSKQPKESNPPMVSGGIAAAAAAAALKKGKQPEESSPSPSSGGIAAAAAAAALKKNKKQKDSKSSASGGIAAAAAAAALKKGKQPEESSPHRSSGGIAAAAAAAATLKRSKQPKEKSPSAARGGIAAAAAAAALARTSKSEDGVSSAALPKRNNVNVAAIPVGGIAAAAAEAALKRRVDKHCHTY